MQLLEFCLLWDYVQHRRDALSASKEISWYLPSSSLAYNLSKGVLVGLCELCHLFVYD